MSQSESGDADDDHDINEHYEAEENYLEVMNVKVKRTSDQILCQMTFLLLQIHSIFVSANQLFIALELGMKFRKSLENSTRQSVTLQTGKSAAQEFEHAVNSDPSNQNILNVMPARIDAAKCASALANTNGQMTKHFFKTARQSSQSKSPLFLDKGPQNKTSCRKTQTDKRKQNVPQSKDQAADQYKTVTQIIREFNNQNKMVEKTQDQATNQNKMIAQRKCQAADQYKTVTQIIREFNTGNQNKVVEKTQDQDADQYKTEAQRKCQAANQYKTVTQIIREFNTGNQNKLVEKTQDQDAGQYKTVAQRNCQAADQYKTVTQIIREFNTGNQNKVVEKTQDQDADQYKIVAQRNCQAADQYKTVTQIVRELNDQNKIVIKTEVQATKQNKTVSLAEDQATDHNRIVAKTEDQATDQYKTVALIEDQATDEKEIVTKTQDQATDQNKMVADNKSQAAYQYKADTQIVKEFDDQIKTMAQKNMITDSEIRVSDLNQGTMETLKDSENDVRIDPEKGATDITQASNGMVENSQQSKSDKVTGAFNAKIILPEKSKEVLTSYQIKGKEKMEQPSLANRNPPGQFQVKVRRGHCQVGMAQANGNHDTGGLEAVLYKDRSRDSPGMAAGNQTSEINLETWNGLSESVIPCEIMIKTATED